MTTTEHTSFIENMNKLDNALPSPGDKSVTSVCDIYTTIKPFLEAILPIIEKLPWIPWVGTLAKAIRFLMTIADSFCEILPSTK